jgi:outer membrane autotransporter protein
VQFSPFVQANYLYIHETSFNEHGAESLSLHVQKKNSDLLEGEAGFEIARCFSAATNHFSPFAGFSVIREWRFTGKQMKSSFKGSSCVMRTTGMNPDRTLYSPTAGLTFLLPNENQTLSFEYKGKFGEKFHDNRFLAQFLIKF